MTYIKEFGNGLKLVVAKMTGAFSVSCGVLVKTGSINETKEENGISHFIEHTVFKGTKKRSAFDISDFADGIVVVGLCVAVWKVVGIQIHGLKDAFRRQAEADAADIKGKKFH